MQPFVANTDFRWFEFLRGRAVGGRVDEVNFWSPSATRPMRRMTPGEPVFFRLKSPRNVVAGYGFFAHHTVLSLDQAWRLFEWRNGDETELGFLRRIGSYRGEDLLDARRRHDRMGCTVLRDARFLPEERWLPWGAAEGWAANVVQGKSETDPARVGTLLAMISNDAARQDVEDELSATFSPLLGDWRARRECEQVVREGQGTFRARLLDAYGCQCAISGEHTEPVLDAAHIQPYRGPPSNHVQNGLLLTKEFHALFDLGYVGVTPEYRVRVSGAIRDLWNNGKRYYAYDGMPLVRVPSTAAERPSGAALTWHMENLFVA